MFRQIIRVEFQYDVHFTRGVFRLENTLLRDVLANSGRGAHKVLVIVEDSLLIARPLFSDIISQYCASFPEVIDLVVEPALVPGGEATKQDHRYVDMVREAIHRHNICRHSYVLAIGGGALLDMVGYATATTHRGVRLIRLPTTVLAQDDSGVGVKNAVNLFGKKNFIGTFAPPFAVINDFEFLSSLSLRDWRGGIVEAVKVALIKDSLFFDRIETLTEALVARESTAIEEVICRCAELHLQHIAGSDPFETGSSRPLDFGHWAAHKLEQLTDHKLRHGEAVAIGIALDSTYSYLSGLLPEPSWERIISVLIKLGFDLDISTISHHELIKGLSEFREHLGGELTIMLLSEIGSGVEVHDLNEEIVMRSAGLICGLRVG